MYRKAGYWDINNTNPFARSFYYNNRGMLQLHNRYNDIFINSDKKIQCGDKYFKHDFEFVDWKLISNKNFGGADRNLRDLTLLQNKYYKLKHFEKELT